MPKIGAHVSTAGSLSNSFTKALRIGAECTQIFISPPQTWTPKIHSEKEIEDYRKLQRETGIEPNFVHAAYLINLATSNPHIRQKSIDWLIYSQSESYKLGTDGTIFHVGSSGTLDRKVALNQAVSAASEILLNSPEVNLILETSAGAGNTIGDEFFELGFIINTLQDERVKVCLDTQHIFASGYDLRSKEGVDKMLEEFDKEIGFHKLVAIHTNDSKTPLNSRKDRHENIGKGSIGSEGFKSLVNNDELKGIPFILETPGYNNDGPDKENIDFLRLLIRT